VFEQNAVAKRLYERHGFREWTDVRLFLTS
jgi:predicted GNAT family acetyltransferase